MDKHERLPKEVGQTLYVLKAFAIFSVICAHCVYSGALWNRITSLAGSIGVPVFLLCSGFLFNERENNKRFWGKKVKRIVVPWVLYGIITYLYEKKPTDRTIPALLLWCVGHGTWLYFPAILLCYYFLFKIFRSNAFAWGMTAVFLISNVLEILGLNILSVWLGTPYLNIFNRIGWFAAGIIIRRNGWITVLTEKRKAAVFAGAGSVILAVPYFINSLAVAAKCCTIPWLLCVVYVLFCLAYGMRDNRLLQKIGNETYIIYFLHMQFGMRAANSVTGWLGINKQYPLLLLILYPMINLAVIFIGACAVKKLMELVRLQRFNWVIGLSK